MIDSLLEGKFGTGMWRRHFFLGTSPFLKKWNLEKIKILNTRFLHNKIDSEAGPGIQWHNNSMHAFLVWPKRNAFRVVSEEERGMV